MKDKSGSGTAFSAAKCLIEVPWTLSWPLLNPTPMKRSRHVPSEIDAKIPALHEVLGRVDGPLDGLHINMIKHTPRTALAYHRALQSEIEAARTALVARLEKADAGERQAQLAAFDQTATDVRRAVSDIIPLPPPPKENPAAEIS